MAVLTANEKRKKYTADRKFVIDGFRRSLEWIEEASKINFGSWSIELSRKFGAQIRIHFNEDDAKKRLRVLKRLFSGLTVVSTKKRGDCFRYFTVVDDQKRLEFVWSDYVSDRTEPEIVTEMFDL